MPNKSRTNLATVLVRNFSRAFIRPDHRRMLRSARKSHRILHGLWPFSRARVQSSMVAADVRRRILARKTLPPRYLVGYASCSAFESDEEQNQINHEQQHNGRFEDQHQAIGLIVLEQLVQIVERLEFFINCAVPIAKMKAGGDVLVNAREVPIAEEFGDVGELIAEAGEIDPDFAQLTQDIALTAQGLLAQI